MKKILGVYFREFPDTNSCEMGILEDSGDYQVMDVGNFAYVYNGKGIFAFPAWIRTPEEANWIYLGEF